MKFLVLLLTAWFVLAAPSAAHAEPISALVASIASAIGSLGAIGKAIFGLALKIGVSLLQKAMQKDPEPVGVRGQIEVGGDNPVSFIVGTYATNGQLEYVGTFGKAGKTPNAYLTQVISLGDLPVNGLVDLFVNGEKCTIDYDETKYGDWGYPVTDFEDDGDNALWIKFYDGTQTTADPLLMAEFGDHPDRPWTSDMIGRGVPYAIVTAQFKRDVLTGPPRCTFVIEGIKLYDPRKDTTAGGSGAHRWGQPATYEWSDNPKVIQYNVMRGIYYDGEWFYGGQGMQAFQLPASSWFAAMNECDRLVSIKGGGTEKNFRCGFEVKGDLEPIELCQKLDRACNGKTAENGGIYKTVCGNPGMPVYYFTDEDLIVSEPQSFNPFPGLEKVFNGAHASYPEPDEAWAAKDAPPRYRSDLEAEDDGRRLIANLTYETVPYKRQVQRLMRAALEANRRFRSHQGVFTPAAKLLDPLDVIAWTSARNGYDNKRFQLGAVDDLNNVNQSAAFSELDPADYDWSSDYELPTSNGPLGRVKPQPRVLGSFGVFPATVKDALGVDRRPAILAAWPYNNDDVAIRAIAFQVREAGKTAVMWRGRSDQPEEGEALLAPFSLLPDTDYEVKAKFIGGGNTELFAWSAWLPVRTPNVQLTAADILDGAIVAAKLADAAVEANKIMTGAVTELALADRAVSDLKIKLAAIKTELIENQAVVAAALADVAVTQQKIATNAVTQLKIAADAVTEAKVAVDAITQGKIASNAVSELKLAAAAVTEAKVAVGAITQLKIASGAVGNAQLAALAVDAAKLATNAVTTTKIADDAITTPKLVTGAVVADKVAANAITAAKLLLTDFSNLVVNGDFSQGLDGWTNSGGWQAAVEGSLTTPMSFFLAKTVTTTGTFIVHQENQFAVNGGEEYYLEAMVQAGSAGGAVRIQLQCQNNAGDNAYVRLPDTVFAAGLGWTKISGRVTIPATINGNPTTKARFWVEARDITNATGTIRFGKAFVRRANNAELIVDGAVIASKVAALAIAAANIQAGAITAGKIAADAVTATNIVAGTITSTELASNSVVAAKIAAGAVVAGKIAADAVTAANVVAGTLTAVELASNSIIAAKIAANAVTTAKIATNAVTANEIAAGTITATEIASGAITTVKLAAESVTGAKIAANTIGANHIAANSITAKQLVIMDWENIVPNGQWITGDNAGWGSYPSGWNVVGAGARSPQRGDYILSTPGVADDRTMTTAGLDVPVQGGEQLNVQFDCAGSGSGASWEFRVRLVYYAAGAYLSGSTVTLAGTSVGWQRQNGAMSVPAAADRIQRIEITRAGGGANNAFITNVVVRRKKGGDLIVDGAITADHLAVNSITVGKIADGAISTGKLSDSAITAVKIANGAITAAKISARVITADKLVLGDITYEEIGNNQITTGVTTYTNSITSINEEESWSGIGSVTLNHGDTNCKIMVKAYCVCRNGADVRSGLRIVDQTGGNTAIQTMTDMPSAGTLMVYAIFTPPSGRTSTTFNAQVRVETTGLTTNREYRNRFVEAIALKR